MQAENAPYWFFVIISVLLGFFLVRFWYLVDEIRKDVKELLIKNAARGQQIKTITEDVEEFKERQQEYDKKLNYLQREIERIKK